jgi:hypothetical protein
MHKISFLSKEVSDVYDFCWKFLNDCMETCHVFRWFFGTWFLPMVFYFRLRN